MQNGSFETARTPFHSTKDKISVILVANDASVTGLASYPHVPAGTILGCAADIMADPETNKAIVTNSVADGAKSQAILMHDITIGAETEIPVGAAFGGVLYTAEMTAANGDAIAAEAKAGLEAKGFKFYGVR